MKAVRFHEHGGADVLRYEDAPDPVPEPGHAVVRVRACALNRLDVWERRGLPRVKFPLPHTSGADVAGEIVDAPGFAAGQRVMLQPGTAPPASQGGTIPAPLTTCSGICPRAGMPNW